MFDKQESPKSKSKRRVDDDSSDDNDHHDQDDRAADADTPLRLTLFLIRGFRMAAPLAVGPVRRLPTPPLRSLG